MRVIGNEIKESVHHDEVTWHRSVSQTTRTSEIVGDVGSDIGSVRGPESAHVGIIAALEVESAVVNSQIPWLDSTVSHVDLVREFCSLSRGQVGFPELKLWGSVGSIVRSKVDGSVELDRNGKVVVIVCNGIGPVLTVDSVHHYCVISIETDIDDGNVDGGTKTSSCCFWLVLRVFFDGFDLHLSGAHLEQSWKRRRRGRGC